ncbi:MAG: sugar transferase [Thermodesulfobacteriota bacterium]
MPSLNRLPDVAQSTAQGTRDQPEAISDRKDAGVRRSPTRSAARSIVREILSSGRRFLSVLVFWDVLAAGVSVVLGFELSPRHNPAASYVAGMGSVMVLATVSFVVSALAWGMYDRERLESPLSVAVRSVVVAMCSAGVLFVVNAVVTFHVLGRWIVFISAGAFGLHCALSRTVMALVIAGGRGSTNVLLVGDELAARSIAAATNFQGAARFNVVGLLPAQFDPAMGNPVSFSTLLQQLCADLRVHWVVVQTKCGPGTLEQMLGCMKQGIRVSDYVSFYEEVFQKVPVEHVDLNWLVEANAHCLLLSSRTLKRATDLVVGLRGLISTLPLWPVIALAIKATSRGPVFYTQKRVGIHEKTFDIVKFRTMYQGAEPNGEPLWARLDDDRVTKVGRLLRRTRLDEIPQFINVLRGDMSVVGPRPERPLFAEALGRTLPNYRLRHIVRPGITGWAQVSYRYGASEEDSKEKLRYDLYYIKHGGLFLDLQILVRTVGEVMRGAR